MTRPRFGATVGVLLLLGPGFGEAECASQAGTTAAPTIRLYGVVKQPDAGVALLQFGSARPVALRAGESRRGFTVLRVLAASVQLEGPDGETLEVDLPEALTPAAGERSVAAPPPPVETGLPASGPSAAATPPPDSARALPLAAPAPGERTFSRDEVRLRLQSELPRILASAVVAPRVLGNEVVGLELVAFPTDTVLGETGLVPGDVLLTVNGREVRGAESLAVLVQRFQTASRIDLTVDRDGQVLPLRYRIE